MLGFKDVGLLLYFLVGPGILQLFLGWLLV
jgi:hypothetical protein